MLTCFQGGDNIFVILINTWLIRIKKRFYKDDRQRYWNWYGKDNNHYANSRVTISKWRLNEEDDGTATCYMLKWSQDNMIRVERRGFRGLLMGEREILSLLLLQLGIYRSSSSLRAKQLLRCRPFWLLCLLSLLQVWHILQQCFSIWCYDVWHPWYCYIMTKTI